MAEECSAPRAGGDWLVPPDERAGLRRYVTTSRDRAWLIVALAVLTAAVAIAFVALATKTYEAEAAGILAGVVIAVAAAIAFRALDPRLRREEQLRHLFRIPVIGHVPRETNGSSDMPLSPRLISSATTKAYGNLRGTVSASSRRPGGEVLLVTSSSSSEGKTTTAINLAASLSAAGRRVILVETDLRRPAIGRSLGVVPKRGVVGVLIESVTIDEALITGDSLGLPDLKLLLAENEVGWINGLFSLPAASEMLEEARKLADYVIVDCPPLTDVVDALTLARDADDILLVVRPGTTRLSKLNHLGEILAENGIKPMGFAVVGASRRR